MLLLKINQIKKISQYTEALARKYKKKEKKERKLLFTLLERNVNTSPAKCCW